MSLRITQNVEAFNAYRNLNHTSSAVSKSMARLSSGYRINSAADDAAGLGISEQMRSQVRGLAQAQRNIQDGMSMVQTAEGNLDEVHSMLQRVRELAVQYKNGSLDSNARTSIQNEANQLASEISRIGSQASFNGINLLNSTNTVSFQVGANDGQSIAVSLVNLSTTVGTSYASLSATTNTDISEMRARTASTLISPVIGRDAEPFSRRGQRGNDQRGGRSRPSKVVLRSDPLLSRADGGRSAGPGWPARASPCRPATGSGSS